MLEIAGLVVSSIGLAVDLAKKYKDWGVWEERDVEVDMKWLEVALEKGILDGTKDDYTWRLLKEVPTLELKGTHSVVIAVNKDKRLKYRIVVGKEGYLSRAILVKKQVPKS